MFFTLLLGLSAFMVAGSAAYFSVLGIATLFSGSYYQVLVMAGSLEFGKLIATSFLYRYWNKTTWWLKIYLAVAVLTLMGITSLGIFGYLSAAYHVNSSKFSQIDQQVSFVENQKLALDQEIEQNTKRIETLNGLRQTQEQRVQDAGNYKTPREQAYAAIEKANQEIQTLVERNKALQEEKFKKDSEIIVFNQDIANVKDIGTFKFIGEFLNKPLDTVVIAFICVLICVFDPLAVSLVLAFNIATRGSILKEQLAAVQSQPTELQPIKRSPEEKEPLAEPEQPQPILITETEPVAVPEEITATTPAVIGKIKATGRFKTKP